MKIKSIIPFICLFILSSCSLNTNNDLNEDPKQTKIFQWHLTHVSGGIAGVDVDYELETIIWVFNVDLNGNGTLKVENHNTEDTLQDGLDSGTYKISMNVDDVKTYLFLETNEFGEIITPTEHDLIINQNNMIDGSGADGFIYTFKRKVIDVDK